MAFDHRGAIGEDANRHLVSPGRGGLAVAAAAVPDSAQGSPGLLAAVCQPADRPPHCAGAITVARDPDLFDQDPFARLFAGTTVLTGLFSVVAAPAGPLIERVAGAPWPGGRFPQAG